MSYGFSGQSKSVDTVEADVTAALEAYQSGLAANDYELDPAAVESANAAKDAIIAIAKSGMVGVHGFNFTVSGHANPNHEPRTGWGNDFIQVSVVQYVVPDPPASAAPTA